MRRHRYRRAVGLADLADRQHAAAADRPIVLRPGVETVVPDAAWDTEATQGPLPGAQASDRPEIPNRAAGRAQRRTDPKEAR